MSARNPNRGWSVFAAPLLLTLTAFVPAEAQDLFVARIAMAPPDVSVSNPDAYETYLTAVNASGEAVGGHHLGGSQRDPYFFDSATGVGRIIGPQGEQYAVDSMGNSTGNLGELRDSSGTLIDTFSAAPVGDGSTVHHLTETGFAMGFVRNVGAELTRRAALWFAGVLVVLDARTDHGQSQSRAWGGNELGQAAGFYDGFELDTDREAVVWSGGSTIFLEKLPGHRGSVAHGINSAGQVAGFTDFVDGNRLATLWTLGADTRVLPPVSGLNRSRARAISESGLVSGQSIEVGGPGLVATIWIDRGIWYEAIDLNERLAPADAAKWKLEVAHYVIDEGFIAGKGQYQVSPGTWVERGFVIEFGLTEEIPTLGAMQWFSLGLSLLLAGVMTFQARAPA